MKIGIYLTIYDGLIANADARVEYSLAYKIFEAIETIEKKVVPFRTAEREKIFNELAEKDEKKGIVIRQNRVVEWNERTRKLDEFELDVPLPTFTEEELKKLHVSSRHVFALQAIIKKEENKS